MADGSFTEHTNLEKISTVRRTVTPTQELKGLVVAKASELNHYSPFVIDCRCCSAACNQTKQSAPSSGFQWDTVNPVSFWEELLLVFFFSELLYFSRLKICYLSVDFSAV